MLTGGQGCGVYVLDDQGYRPLQAGQSQRVVAGGVNQLIVVTVPRAVSGRMPATKPTTP